MPERRTTYSGLPVGKATSTEPTVATQSQEPQALGYTYSGLPIRNPNIGAAGMAVNVEPNSWAEYTRLSDHPFLGDPKQHDLSQLQTGKELFMNSVLGAGVNIGAGFMEAVGSWDMEDAYDMASGVNKEYGNWAHDIASNMSEWQNENLPVYERDPGSFNMGDPGWWGNMAKNFGFTLGFAGEAALESIGIGLLTGGAGGGISALSKIRTLKQLKDLARLSTLGEAAWGSFKGLQEATTNGYETFDSARKKYLADGYSDEDATKYASAAAAAGWRTEVGPLMILNAAQYATLAHNPAGMSKGLAERAIGGIENKYARGGAKLAEQMLSEGAEEGWQTISSQEGKYRADVMAGLQTPKDFSERLGEYTQSAELWNAVFAGALGGTAFAGMGAIKNRVLGASQAQQQEDSWDAYKNGMQGMTIDYLSKIRQAEKNGDTATATSLKQEMSLQTALQSYHIDHLKGDSARGTYDAHVTTLQGILKAVNEGNQEAMDAYKIGEDDKEFIQNQFPDMISKAQDAVRIYDSIKGKNDASVLVPMAYRMQLTEDFSGRIDKARQDLDMALDAIPGTKDFSTEGRARLKLEQQVKALDAEEARIKKAMKLGGYELELNGYSERLEEISALREKAKEEDHDLAERQSENIAVAARDMQIRQAIPDLTNAETAAFRRTFNETELHQTRKELAYISDKEYQAASANKRMQKLMDQATTSEQVDTIVNADAKANRGKASSNVQQAADKKKKTLAAQNAVNATNQKMASNQPPTFTTPTDNNQIPPAFRPGTGPANPNIVQPAPPVSGVGNAPEHDPDALPGTAAKFFTPGMVSLPMRKELRNLKFTDAEIDAMTPAEAQQNLSWKFDDSGNIKISAARSGPLGDAMDMSVVKTGGGKIHVDLNSGVVYDDQGPIMLPDYDDSSESERAAWELKVAKALSNYVESMAAEPGAKPVMEITFRDMLRDLIHHKNKAIAEANFELYKLGWTLNKYKPTDFEADYKVIFGDRTVLADELNLLSAGLTAQTESEVQRKDLETEFETGISRDPLKYVYDESGERKPQRKGYRTDSPALAIGFLNQGYTEQEILNPDTGEVEMVRVNDDNLFVGPYYDSRPFMLPDKFLPGDKLTAKVPDNPGDIEITEWNRDYSRSRRVKFGEWAERNRVLPGSDMWAAMIPVFVYDSEGIARGEVRNTEWYNPQNVAGENDPTPERQTKIILEGRANLMGLRKTLLESGAPVELTITKKTTGSKTINKEGRKPISQMDPSTVLAYITSGNVIVNSSGQEIYPEQIVKKETDDRYYTMESGPTYDLRQTGMITTEVYDKDEKKFVTKTVPQYMPLGTNKPEALDAHSQSSVAMAIRVFLSQWDQTGELMDPTLRDQIHAEVLRISGNAHDLKNEASLRQYLLQFVATPYGKYERNDPITKKYSGKLTMQALHADVNGKDKVPIGTPFLTVYNNTVVIGIKGRSISNSPDYTVRFVSPGIHEKAVRSGDVAGQQTYLTNARALMSILTAPQNPGHPQNNSILPRMKNNVSGRIKGGKIALITDKGVVSDGGEYVSYLKDRLTTDVKAYQIGDSYATFVQPRIEFTYDNEAAATAAEKRAAAAVQAVPVPVAPAFTSLREMVKKYDISNAPVIPVSAIDMEESFGDPQFFELYNIRKIRVLETRGRNAEGRFTGTVLVNLTDDTGTSAVQKHEVVFTEPAAPAATTVAPQPSTPQPLSDDKAARKAELLAKRAQNAAGLKERGITPGGVNMLPNYETDTDDVVSQVIENLTKVKGMSMDAVEDTVNFIARQIESQVDTKYKSQVSKKTVMESVKSVLEDTLEKSNRLLEDEKAILEELAEIEPLSVQEQLELDQINNVLAQTQLIKDNWSVLSADAMEAVLSETGIVESTKDFSEFAQEMLDALKDLGYTDLPKEQFELLRAAAEGETEQYAGASEVYRDILGRVDGLDLDELDRYSETSADDGSETENNFSYTSLQENNKGSLPYLFRRFTSSIPGYTTAGIGGEVAKGFAGLTKYPGYGYYFDKIMSLLLDGSDTPPSYDAMVAKLEQDADRLPWLRLFLDKMNAADQQVRNGFSYGMNLHASNSKFLMFWDNDGDYGTRVYDTNSSEIKRKIQEDWYQNFRMSPLVDQSGKRLNVAEMDRLIGVYDSWYAQYQGKNGPPPAEAAEWLKSFGITLSPETINEVAANGRDGGIRLPNGNKMFWSQMFGVPSQNSNSIFMVLRSKLRQLRDEAEMNPAVLDVTDRESDGNLFKVVAGVSGALSKFANIEKKYSSSTSTASYRDGDKNIYGYTAPSMSSHVEMKLKNDRAYREALNEVEPLRGSFVLQMIRSNEDFKHKFDMTDMAISSIKQIGRKNTRPTEFNQLSEEDLEYTMVGMFQDEQIGEVNGGAPLKVENIYGKAHTFLFRMANMVTLTTSDKTSTKMMQTAAIKLRRGVEMLTAPDGEVFLSEEALAFAFSQLVEPELRRACAHHKAAENGDVDTLINIDGYNSGAQMFIGIPELNTLKIQGTDLATYIAKAGSSMTDEFVNTLISDIKEDAHKFLQKFFKSKVDYKIGTKENPGTWAPFIEWNGDGSVRSIHYLNAKYLKTIGEPDRLRKLKMAALDYVFNTHIHNANTLMLHGLDLAHFSVDKAFKDDFHESETGSKRFMPWLPRTASAYYKAVKNYIDVNLGKRLAMLIAPRKSLHNSRGDKFIRLALEDRRAPAQNMDFLIEVHYGKAVLSDSKVQQWLSDLKNLDDKIPEQNKQIADARKGLSNRFPEIAGFFDITSTDAEEYVTGKEAIDTLFRQGRLSEHAYNAISAKLEAGEDLSYSELQDVSQIMVPMQPTKPVHTGTELIKTASGKMMRVDYVKSSAIPLLPQTTKGKEIDHLRRDMEDLQRLSGKNVRAVYHSGTKVGDVLAANRIKIWDSKGNYIKGVINVADFVTQAADASKARNLVVMDRENWGIQQDVPAKVDKKEANTVSQISQAMKGLFGDGVLKIGGDIFELNGKKVTAEELKAHFDHHSTEMVKNEKTRLYDALGINEATGKPFNDKITAEKIQEILQTEAKAKGYSRPTLAGLALQDDVAFALPIWMAPEADKFETLLNSIITNRLVQIKFPGSQFVNVSEEGFKTLAYEDELAAGNIDHGKMIYTPSWTGQLEAARFDKDGNFLSSQVIMSQQFQKPDGTFIDLIKDGYAQQDANGRWMLDMSKVDKSLLSLSSFRIPLSGHVSMSQLEIVAFLPPEQSGIAILPRNLITQKGFDFDVDKEFTYQLHHKLMNGRIVPLTSDNTRQTAKNKTKLHQNEIVKVFQAFLSCGDPQIQKRINKVFDIKYEQGQRDAFNNITAGHDPYFSIFDDEHQKRKRALGAAGKSSIGTYANMLSFHNLIQQNPKPMQLRETITIETDKGPKPVKVPFTFWLCGYKSDGVLGSTTTHDGNRGMIDSMGGKLQISTDNEKEQVLGAVGINSTTIGADVLLTSLKYDKARTSIPGLVEDNLMGASYLLLSQPIIKDYVKTLQGMRGLTSDYTPNAKKKAKEEMIAKYSIGSEKDIADIYGRDAILEFQKEYLTTDSLIREIQNGGQNKLMQQVALDLFLKLDDGAKTLGRVYSNVNIQTSGLGKSIPETLALYDEVENMGKNALVTNVDGLVGEFRWEFTEGQIPDYQKEGYMHFVAPGDMTGKGFLVKPTTLVGAQVLSAAKSGYELWSDFYPYNNPAVREITNNMMMYMSSKDDTNTIKAEKKKKIMDYIKMALFSSRDLGMFTGEAQEERYRLFMDNTDSLNPNMSLATYLKKLQSVKSASADFVNKNSLISAFEYSINTNNSARTGQLRAPQPGVIDEAVSLFEKMEPSYFIYNNAQGADVGEDHKYMALMELMSPQNNQIIRDENGEPITYNGLEYTTRMLAKDIMAASYLKSGIQRATEVTKYVPIPYLLATDFASVARRWQADSKNDMNGTGTGKTWDTLLGKTTPPRKDVVVPWRVERQIVQHIPRDTPSIPEEFKGKANGSTFFMDPAMFAAFGNYAPPFVHFAKGKDDVRLFEKDPLTMQYTRINTLGVDGRGLSSEMSITQSRVLSIANVNVFTPRLKSESVDPPVESGSDAPKDAIFKLNEGNLSETLMEIQKAQIPVFSDTAALLLPFVNNDTKLVIDSIGGRGSYEDTFRTITIGKELLESPRTGMPDIAQAVLHEYVHSITANELNKYFNRDGSFKEGVNTGNLPAHITKLHRAFSLMVNRLGEKKVQDFVENYNKTKKFRPLSKKAEGEIDDMLLYAGYDIHEMLAVVMTSEELRTYLSTVEAVPGMSVTLLQRFADALVKFMEAVGVRPGSLNAQVMEAILETAQMQKQRLFAGSFTGIKQDMDYAKIMGDYTIFSGGAEGSDEAWGRLGEEFGIGKQFHFWSDTPTPFGNAQITVPDYMEGSIEAARAAARNWGYNLPKMSNGLLIRNWSQVKYADAVFAVGEIVQPGERIFPNQQEAIPRLAVRPSIAGGTGYAVGMAIIHGKPVYVFDQPSERWHTWSESAQNFIPVNTPVLTKNFAGIGTRHITAAGEQAIRDVYQKTVENAAQVPVKEKLNSENFDLAAQLADATRAAEIAEAQKRVEGPNVSDTTKTSGFSEFSMFPYVESEVQAAMAEIDKC